MTAKQLVEEQITIEKRPTFCRIMTKVKKYQQRCGITYGRLNQAQGVREGLAHTFGYLGLSFMGRSQISIHQTLGTSHCAKALQAKASKHSSIRTWGECCEARPWNYHGTRAFLLDCKQPHRYYKVTPMRPLLLAIKYTFHLDRI